jgi:hypothetical protein
LLFVHSKIPFGELEKSRFGCPGKELMALRVQLTGAPLFFWWDQGKLLQFAIENS